MLNEEQEDKTESTIEKEENKAKEVAHPRQRQN